MVFPNVTIESIEESIPAVSVTSGGADLVGSVVSEMQSQNVSAELLDTTPQMSVETADVASGAVGATMNVASGGAKGVDYADLSVSVSSNDGFESGEVASSDNAVGYLTDYPLDIKGDAESISAYFVSGSVVLIEEALPEIEISESYIAMNDNVRLPYRLPFRLA